MSIERDLLTRMFNDDLEMARGLVAIKDYAMAAETLARAIEKIHQIAALDRPLPSGFIQVEAEAIPVASTVSTVSPEP